MQVLGHLLFVKVGLPGHRTRGEVLEADLQDWIRSFELVSVNATAYCIHVATNCLTFIEGVRIFDK